MKFSYNLLKTFVPIKKSPQQLAEILTEHAFEIEEVTAFGGTGEFYGIVAAKVLAVEKHPNADRLRIVKLDVGQARGPQSSIIYPVVCGAFNFNAGAVVALALPGAKIAQNIHSQAHEAFTLQKATIRGIESQGMICAEFELGLIKEPGTEPAIMLLDKSIKPGTPLAQVLGKKPYDYILNAALPANRSDLHSHLGVAREIAAVTNEEFKNVAENAIRRPQAGKSWKAIVKNKNLVPRYYGVRLKVKVAPSPKFMADFLSAVGMRPINNVVDITNYVMLELGNPTHAFDAKFVAGNIVVKTAQKGEKFLALNHKEYALDDDTLMIGDEKKNLAIGAIIGGKESEVTQATSEIILEVANFEPTGIRRTSKKLGLVTEGSRMWEKGVHPKLAELALARALKLLTKYAEGKIIEFAKFETAVKSPPAIKFTTANINKLLGTDIGPKAVQKYLTRYGFSVKSSLATPPWWRMDVTSMPDLAEEVLKLYGYNNVRPQAIEIFPDLKGEDKAGRATDDIYQSKEIFACLGYTEVQNYNFLSEKDILKSGGRPEEHVEIQNPLSEDQRYLKKYAQIPLLKNIALNQKHFNKFKLFEVTKEYLGFENEPSVLLAAIFSKQAAPEKMLMALKADILEFFKSLGQTEISFAPARDNWLDIKHDGQILGGLGLAGKSWLQNFDVEGNVVFAKLQLEKTLAQKTDTLYKDIGKFPNVERDISIVVKKSVSWADIEAVVRPFMGNQTDLSAKASATADKSARYAMTISLFEAPFFTHDKDSALFHEQLLKKGQKNLGIRLLFKPKNHTLTDIEITGILDQIVLQLKQKIGAEVR